MIRIDKYLADMGAGTRSEVKKMIRQGLVTVDGEVIRKSEAKVSEDQKICLAGIPYSYVEFEYYMLNKPAGVVSATEDSRDTTVIELIDDRQRKDLFPVGRLDKDTEGLLLITNDGDLAHRLLAPKKHVDKVYFAVIDGLVTEKDQEVFRQGVDIGEDHLTMPADLKILSAGDQSEIEITVREGKFHQIKRMFQAVDKEVIYLKRLSMGALVLDLLLAPGEYRALTKEELESLC